MKRLKTFLIYALIIAAFWVFSDILIYVAVNGTYAYTDAKIQTNSPEIIVKDSKATYINGYVKGSIKNNTEGIINEKYVKIDLYSPRDVKLGTKYVKVENLQPNQYQDFEMWYKYTDVEYAVITTTDDIQNVPEEEFISEKTASYMIVGALILLYFL